MPSDGRIDLLLRLDAGDPIRGSLRALDGPCRDFRGWLGLAAAIEELAHPALVTPPTSTSAPED